MGRMVCCYQRRHLYPFELYELFKGVTWLALGALVVNVAVVALMINALLRTHRVETVDAV